MFKGILYSNVFFYNFITKIKLGKNENLRFLLAANYIDRNQSILDYCAGIGRMKDFLPENCYYSTLEMSDRFSAYLESKGIPNYKMNPLEKMPVPEKSFDIVIMIISLSHFRHNRIDDLLVQMKKIARKKVIIVEEVIYKYRDIHKTTAFSLRTQIINRIGRLFINFLTSKPYTTPAQQFSPEELEAILEHHSLKIFREKNNYIVGIWESDTKTGV